MTTLSVITIQAWDVWNNDNLFNVSLEACELTQKKWKRTMYKNTGYQCRNGYGYWTLTIVYKSQRCEAESLFFKVEVVCFNVVCGLCTYDPNDSACSSEVLTGNLNSVTRNPLIIKQRKLSLVLEPTRTSSFLETIRKSNNCAVKHTQANRVTQTISSLIVQQIEFSHTTHQPHSQMRILWGVEMRSDLCI